jgi:4-aminobutyrate aminotransferase
LPLAAIIARDDLNIAGRQALGHYTHEKNPVLCAAALATISFIEENNLLEQAAALGRYALERLRTMMATQPLIGDVRGLGLLLGLELVRDRETKARAFAEAEQVMYRALSKGLSFKVTMGNVISLIPPLTVSQQELDIAFDILAECLSARPISHRLCGARSGVHISKRLPHSF